MSRLASLRSALERAVRFLVSRISWLCAHLFGHWNWESPAWVHWTGRQWSRFRSFVAADRKRAAGLLVVVIAAVAALAWYVTRPKPDYVPYVVIAPPLTVYDDMGVQHIKPMRVEFQEAVAPLKNIEKAVTTGIETSPAIAGTWFWVSDRELQLTPRDDWPIDTSFKVRIASKGFLAEHVQLEENSFTFATEPFRARFSESQFYQDPRDPNLKKLVATVQFTHPVDAADFETHISLEAAKDAAYLGLKPGRNFTVIYDKLKLVAHIHSSALAMPRDDTSMKVRLAPGIRASRGGNETSDILDATIGIPGRTSLRFSDARMTLVDNARYEPEQILLVQSSSPVAEKALSSKVTACVLPERHPKQPKEDLLPYRWTNESEIGAEFISQCEDLALSYVPSEEGGNTSHGLKFRAPVGRYVFASVKSGVEGIGGYIAGKTYVAVLNLLAHRNGEHHTQPPDEVPAFIAIVDYGVNHTN